LIRLAEALLEYETLDGIEIQTIVKGQPMKPRPEINSDIDSEGTAAKEKAPGHTTLPSLINPKGKPAPA